MDGLQIIPVKQEDLLFLRELSIQTFTETYAAYNTEANMQQYIADSFSVETLTQEIRNPLTTFFIAFYNNIAIGYIKLNKGSAQLDLNETSSIEIERIYLLRAYQGKGIGTLLYEFAVQQALLHNVSFLWLGVWEQNKPAIHFYEKHGFVAEGTRLFTLGDDRQIDIIMRKSLF